MVAKPLNQFLAKYIDKIIIVLFPLLLISLNSNWIFTPATDFLPDPWFYLGYFRYFYEYAPVFPSNIHYFVERLTWIIPGLYIYRMFPPLLANYVLHLLVYYLALFSLYGTLNFLFNRRAAFISALLMGSYAWFLRAAGWDYVDGVGIALMLLLIYILTMSSRSEQWRLYLFFAGIIHAALFTTNLFWLGFAPSWGFYFLLVTYPTLKSITWKLLGEISYFLLGTVTLLVTVGFFYHSVTGEYNFFKNGLAFSIFLSRNPGNIDFARNLYKHMPPFWHLLPILIGLGAAWRLWRSRETVQDKSHHFLKAISCLFVLAYGWLILWHSVSVPYLIIFLYSSFIIPAVFLLLGAIMAPGVEKISGKDFSFITATAILALAAPFILVVIFPTMETWQGNILLITLLSLIFLVSISISGNKATFAAASLVFSTLSFLGAVDSYVFLPEAQKGRDSFNAIIEASEIIDAYYPNHTYTDFRMWYRADQNYDTFFSLSSLYLYPWGSAIDNPESGKKPHLVLTFPQTDEIKDGDKLVIAVSDPNPDIVMKEANQALAYRNASLEMESSIRIQKESLQFTLYFTKIKMASNSQ